MYCVYVDYGYSFNVNVIVFIQILHIKNIIFLFSYRYFIIIQEILYYIQKYNYVNE